MKLAAEIFALDNGATDAGNKHRRGNQYARLRNTGKLTVEEVANLLGVSIQTARRWGKEEIIKTYPYNDRNGCLFEHPGVNSPLMTKTA